MSKEKKENQKVEGEQGIEVGRRGEEKTILAWESESRPFKKRGRDYYSTVLVLAILVGVIFFFIEGLMPVLLVASVVFVVFAVSKAEPRVIKHKITTRGVATEGGKFWWDELVTFWLEEKWGYDLVHILTLRRWPRRVLLVLPKSGEVSKKKAKEVLGSFLPLEKPEETGVDKVVKWLGEKIPLEG